MDEVVRLGLFRLVDEQAHELREHYDDADDLIETWEDIVEPELERRIRVPRVTRRRQQGRVPALRTNHRLRDRRSSVRPSTSTAA